MREYSETAWNIASQYSDILASETRDLAAHIDGTMKAKDAEIERLRAALQAIVNYDGESFDFPSNDGWMIVDIARKALEQ